MSHQGWPLRTQAYGDVSITGRKIADGSVSGLKLQNGSVPVAKLIAGTANQVLQVSGGVAAWGSDLTLRGSVLLTQDNNLITFASQTTAGQIRAGQGGFVVLDAAGALQDLSIASTGAVTVRRTLTITGTGASAGGGLVVSANGATVTGGLTVPSGGMSVTGNSTVSGTLGGISTLTATTLIGTIGTAAQPNITSLGTLTGLSVAGNISASGTLAAGTNGSSIPGLTVGGAGLTVNAGGIVVSAAGVAVQAGGLSISGTGARLVLATFYDTLTAGTVHIHSNLGLCLEGYAAGSYDLTLLGRGGGAFLANPAGTANTRCFGSLIVDVGMTVTGAGVDVTGSATFRDNILCSATVVSTAAVGAAAFSASAGNVMLNGGQFLPNARGYNAPAYSFNSYASTGMDFDGTFLTFAVGAAKSLEIAAASVRSVGTIYPVSPGLRDLGIATTNTWRDVYATRGAFNGSTADLKRDWTPIDAATALDIVRGTTVGTFRYKPTDEDDLMADRLRVGIIADDAHEWLSPDKSLVSPQDTACLALAALQALAARVEALEAR